MGNWKEIELGQVCKLKGGFAFKSEDFQIEGIPLVKISNIQDNKTVKSNGDVFISDNYLETHSNFVLRNGDVVIAMSGATTGKIGKVNEFFSPSFLNQRVGLFQSKDDSKVDLEIIYQIFSQETLIQHILGNAGSSAQPNISPSFIENIKIQLPEYKPEQTRIAEILSTADQTIAHTEALIAKYQRIKTGLMQDLLTKGIDKNGNIRSKETQKFVIKNGIEVPEEWEVVPLSYFIKRLESGVSVNSNDKPAGSGQFGVLKTSVLSGCVFNSNQNKTVDDNEIKRLKCPVRKDAIVISRMNTPDLVGENALVEIEYENLYLPDRLWQTVFQRTEELNVYWISKLLSSTKYRQKISFQATGTSGTMKNITKNDFLNIFIPKPDITEQNVIAKIFESTNLNETGLNSSLQKLQSLKTGLMHDLLSGKVRLKI